MGSFNDEMAKRLDPLGLELEKLAEQLMDKVEGKFMEGFGDIFTDAGEKKEDNG